MRNRAEWEIRGREVVTEMIERAKSKGEQRRTSIVPPEIVTQPPPQTKEHWTPSDFFASLQSLTSNQTAI